MTSLGYLIYLAVDLGKPKSANEYRIRIRQRIMAV